MDSPQITVQSFGFLHEVPEAPIGALLVDLRTALRNPHDDPQMRYRTGKDDDVRQHVLETPRAFEVIGRTTRQAIGLFQVNDRQFQMARILIGCQGGRHRSVVVADMVTEALNARGFRAEVEHLHIDRPVVQR